MKDFNSMKQSVTNHTNFCNKFITKDAKLHSIFLSIMSFLTELLTKFTSISPKNQNPNSSLSSLSNQSAAFKLKGYFDLATEEIYKAVRAEEWRLIDDAVVHYQYAQRILREAIVTCVPSSISSREQEKVKSYRQKLSKWQGQVSERLFTLNHRSGSTSTNKKTLPRIQTTVAPSLKPMTRKLVPQTSSGHTLRGATTRTQSNKETKSKPAQGFDGGLDPKLVEMINSYIVKSQSVKWEDIAGLEKAKQALLEMVILPTKRKDLFTGLRRPPKGLLLFGPPGTGKTMLAKAVASESQATFFNIPPSSVTSKWVGEGEKLVRTLFAVAVARQPSVIFMDEIDSLLSARTSNEHDASRRLKSEFLVQCDGVSSNSNDLVIVIGATNKPQELDDAVLRRLVKRIYIPLPDANVRRSLFKHKLKGEKYSLPSAELERLVKDTEGYTGSDLQALCEEAALMPIRELGSNILTVKADQVRRLRYGDFQKAMTVVRPSYLKSKWEELEHWNKEFGSN